MKCYNSNDVNRMMSRKSQCHDSWLLGSMVKMTGLGGVGLEGWSSQGMRILDLHDLRGCHWSISILHADHEIHGMRLENP